MPTNYIGAFTHPRNENTAEVDSPSKKQMNAWCPKNIDEVQCGRYPSGRIGVYDIISQSCVENEEDVFDADDGHCFDRQSLIEWFEAQRFNRNEETKERETPRYPLTRQEFTENDVQRLGIQNFEFPNEENKYDLAYGEPDEQDEILDFIKNT